MFFQDKNTFKKYLKITVPLKKKENINWISFLMHICFLLTAL